ncbi:MAG: rhomboid family intramembrane serine protease [Phycisphaerae bacterium]
MGVYDRDYTKTGAGRGAGIAWGAHLPPRGALALIVLHGLGFLTVLMMRHDAGGAAATMFVLRGAASHPAAIVLHPIGSESILTLAFVAYAIWTLGGRIESRWGTTRLLSLYVLGTIISGGVYFGFAQRAPDLAGYALVMPTGALAAWALAAWRNLSDEMVSVFGRLVTVAKATAIGAAIVAGLVFFRGGPAATAWLIAAAAGSLAWPVVNVFRGNVRASSAARQLRRARAARPPTRCDAAQPVAEDPAIDDLLAKISREGLDALTPAERERLEAARQAKLRQSR